MSSAALTLCVALDALALQEPRAWREALARDLRQGQRLLTLFGRRTGEEVTLTAVLAESARGLRVLRTVLDARSGFHELTSEHAALHCFERELHEQTGVRIAGHPWLKPLRFEGAHQGTQDHYPFYALEGKEVHEVQVGPIHAGVIEPGAFRFQCLGEQVHHLEIHLGYQHRGVEARLLERDARTLTPLVETIAGDSSVAHAWAYCAALEGLAQREVTPAVERARAIALELERSGMHLAGLAGLATDIAFLQGATTYGRLRTTAINAQMRLCGSRFGHGALRPGTARLRLSAESRRDLGASLALLRRDLAPIHACFLAARTVQQRLRGVGVLTRERAQELGLVGLAARASGIELDARLGAGGAYALLPLAAVVEPDGDCWARARVRIRELDASLAWLEALLLSSTSWEHVAEPLGPLAPRSLSVALVEGWRGEVVHVLETGARGELVHYKVQDPSLRNWMGLAIAMRGNEISDFPICNKSFDLSYCGHDL